MKDIKSLKNEYKGERAFIIGNGPSLTNTPLSKLDSEYTFGMNKINKIYSDTEWRPTFYYCANPLWHVESTTDQIKENINQNVTCILNSDYSKILNSEKNVHYVETKSLFHSDFHQLDQDELRSVNVDRLNQYWSEEVHKKVYHYHTMYGVIQLASYMGFNKLYLLGCDLGMEYKNPHMIFLDALDPYRHGEGKFSFAQRAFKDHTPIKSLINGIAYLAIQNKNTNKILSKIYNNTSNEHFDSEYIDGFRIHDGKRVENEIIKSHIAAKKICGKKNIEIYNSTLGGELEIYPRRSLTEIVNKICDEY